MRAGSLFSGIGGLDLGLHMSLGCEPAWFCEIDKHCVQVLNRHWPDVPVLPDVRDTAMLAEHGPIDVLHGGYPCQPFSHAGVRRGENDPRHLWPAFASAIRVLRPRLVIGENVAGHLTLGFDQVLGDLAEMGFDVRWGVVRASDTGAPHQRARLFWVASDARRAGTGGNGTGPFGQEEPHRRCEAGNSYAPEPGDATSAHPCGERHGGGQNGGSLGRLDGRSAGEARQRQRSRSRTEPEHRGATLVADADDGRREQHNQEVGGLSISCSRHAPATDTACRDEPRIGEAAGLGRGFDWGAYAPAVHRWERIHGHAVPCPTDARGRLMPAFVEWMMGFPAGWTDGPARTHQLRMLGNAVVPAQAALAMSLLLSGDAA